MSLLKLHLLAWTSLFPQYKHCSKIKYLRWIQVDFKVFSEQWSFKLNCWIINPQQRIFKFKLSSSDEALAKLQKEKQSNIEIHLIHQTQVPKVNMARMFYSCEWLVLKGCNAYLLKTFKKLTHRNGFSIPGFYFHYKLYLL